MALINQIYKFKKGDRVRYTGAGVRAYRGGCLLQDTEGTVQEDSAYPFVAWDGFTHGHDYADDSGSTNQWAVDEYDLKRIEPSVEFKIGQRVCVTDGTYEGCEGTVVEGNYTNWIAVQLDDMSWKSYWRAWQLTSIEQAPTSPAKPECYVTAWFSDDAYCLTDAELAFVDKASADEHAKDLVAEHGEEVAVFKMVSKHSSAVTVTSEDL